MTPCGAPVPMSLALATYWSPPSRVVPNGASHDGLLAIVPSMEGAPSPACASCGAALAPDAVFCSQCGTRRTATCTGCGVALDSDARFCPRCGAPVRTSPAPPGAPAPEPVAERRWASVLFADLVGFTTLSESRDPEQVRELLSGYFDRCRQIIASYDGAVEKFIGDAVMAVWGVPTAHEDDAERAVRAGLDLAEMVTALGEELHSDLALRVGVVTGEVAATLGATSQGMVAGDPVNTAARLQTAADPGRIYVDAATHALTASVVDYDDVGERSLKGKAEPQRLFAVRGVRREREPGTGVGAPMIGRERELGLLRDLFEVAAAEGRPRLVVVDGDAGVGKSRLLEEFERWVDSRPGTTRWHRGRCIAYGDGVTFHALSEAFRTRLGLIDSDDATRCSDRLDRFLADAAPDAEERAWLQPRVATLIGASAEGRFDQGGLFSAWTRFLEIVGAGDPVVLVIDDAHHADDGLLDFVDYVLAATRTPTVVIAMARPDLLERRPGWGGRRTAVVPLAPLSHDETRALIAALLDGAPAATQDALAQRVGGLPLFAVETVRSLVDQHLAVLADGRATLTDAGVELGSLPAPTSLRSLVRSRLDALPPDQGRVVGDASVLGLSFAVDGLSDLAPDGLDVSAAVAELRRREILDVDSDRFSADRGQLRFTHAVVRQVAYDTLSRRDRKARHIAAAHYVATQPGDVDVIVAQHLLDAIHAAFEDDADVADLTSTAVEHLERGAGRAATMGAPAEAQHLLELALDHIEEPRRRAQVHLAAARAATTAGDQTAARDHASAAASAFDALHDDVAAGHAAAVQALAMARLAEPAAAIATAAPRWTALEGRSDAEPALIELATALSQAHQRIGDYDAMGAYSTRMLVLAESAGDPATLAAALTRVGTARLLLDDPVDGRRNLKAAADLAREHNLGDALASALMNLSSLENSRDLSAALSDAHEAHAVALRSGNRYLMDYSIANYLCALWQRGDLNALAPALRDALDSATDVNIRSGLRTIEVWLADATGRGAPEPDEDRISGSDDLSLVTWQDSADLTRALSRGDAVHAADLAAGSFPRLLTAIGFDDDFCVLWPPLVVAAIAAGRGDLGQRFLQPVEDAPPHRVSPAVAAQWHRLRGGVSAVRGDDPRFAEAEMRLGIEALDAFGAHGYRAQAQEELARWLVDQDRAHDARRFIDAARATYADLGAHGWLARLDAWDIAGRGAPSD